MLHTAEDVTVTVVGNGFSGALFALKMASARPGWTIQLVGDAPDPGTGLAYGRCDAQHLLNVPVGRMEVGLQPGFQDWLAETDSMPPEARADGAAGDAFVPRRLFGLYLAAQLARSGTVHPRLRIIKGQAVRLQQSPRRVVLEDGQALATDMVVLATGHLPPRLPFPARASSRIVVDPWAPWPQIAPQARIVLAGTGLTMVDVVLSLRARGHQGRIHALSRHGLLPRVHRAGGAWPALPSLVGASPSEALRIMRQALKDAEAAGVPWQRVFDAARPSAASTWHHWTLGQRAGFLRHLRAYWDVHRHRMVARNAAQIESLREDGTLRVDAAAIIACDSDRQGVSLMVRPRGGRPRLLEADLLINCTGPGMDPRRGGNVFVNDILAQGLGVADPLGLGLESADGTLTDAQGKPGPWLHAVGPLTRPAWWEIVAVPEINAQVDRLVRRLAASAIGKEPPLDSVFFDLGAGI